MPQCYLCVIDEGQSIVSEASRICVYVRKMYVLEPGMWFHIDLVGYMMNDGVQATPSPREHIKIPFTDLISYYSNHTKINKA